MIYKNKIFTGAAQVVIALLISANIYAANQVVTTNADSGAGSLRQAILDIESSGADGDEITFNLTAGNETIILSSQLSVTSRNIIIDGDNTAGSGTDVTVQVTTPGVSTFRIIEIQSNSGTFSLKNMTLKGGDVSGAGFLQNEGGGIKYVAGAGGTLSLENITISESKADSAGALYAEGGVNVLLTNCTIENNESTVNSGGAVYVWDITGSLSISDSVLDSNTSARQGGALYINRVLTSIDNTTFSNNTNAGFGGGAIYWSGNGVSGVATVTNSTFNNNSGSNGGAIEFYYGNYEVTNSTFFQNEASNAGGAIFNAYAVVYLTNITVAENLIQGGVILNGGGVSCQNGATYHIKNSLLANNSPNDYHSECTLTDNGYNLVEISHDWTNGVNDNMWTGSNNIHGDQVNLNLATSLADNGTLNNTQTLALNTGSVAIDAGDASSANSGVAIPATDQRGLGRVSTTDIGAYEGGNDVTAPTGTVSIDTGAAYTPSTPVILTLSCSDDVGCAQMQFSNDNSTWSTLEANATSKNWTLAAGADGTRTVYARFNDAAGNLSSAVSDSILLDTTAPAAPVISSPANNITTDSTTRPAISGTAEAGATVTISDGTTVLGSVTATGGNWSLAGGATLTEGAHSFTAIAVDEVGNASAASAAVTYTVNIASADTGIETGTRGIGAFTWWPVVLLVLMLRRFKSNKTLLMMFALLIAQFNTLHAEPAVYVGAGFGQSTLSPETSGSAYDVSDDSSQSSHLMFGYRLDSDWLIELGWNDLGNAEISTSGTKAGDIDYTTYTLGGAYRVYTNQLNSNDFNVYLSAGVSRLDTDTSLSITRKNENSIFIGGIAEYMFSKSLALRAKLESYDEDASSLSLNVVGYLGK